MKVEAKAVAEAQHGALLSLDRSAPFPFKEEFPDADEVVQTRLGSQGPLLQLPGGTLGAFGEPISQIAPPAQWCHGLTGNEAVAAEVSGNALQLTVADKTFTYDRAGLRPLEAKQ